MPKQPIRAKITIIGDGNTGKSMILHRYIHKTFNDAEYQPTVFDNKIHQTKYKGRVIELDLWDTAGQEDYSRIMPLSFPNSDLILIVYNIAEPQTLQSAFEKWLPEVKFHCKDTPFILVGNKRDLRFDNSIVQSLALSGKNGPATEQDGVDMAQKMKAQGFFECSALSGDGVEELFEFIIKKVYKDHRTKNSCKFFRNMWNDLTSCFK